MEPQSSQLARKRHDHYSPKVLLDGRKIGDGGIGTYVSNLVTGLLESRAADVTVISSRERAEKAPFANDVDWIYDDAKPYSVDELFLMPRRIDFSRFDVFHTPHFVLPYGISIPSVVTIHDLIHITNPERLYFPRVARALIRSAVKRASAVITVSNDTRRAVLELTNADASKVRHIPNAVAYSLIDHASGTKSSVSKRHVELSPFFLSVFSNVKPHKALPDLIAAFREFRSAKTSLWEKVLPRAPRLVVTGFGTQELLNTPELLRIVGNAEGVHVLGPVSQDELGALFRKALAVVVPSVAEGFCLPALEARVSGTPVVCRPVPALLELVTERDIVASDMSVHALAAAMAEQAGRGMEPRVPLPRVHFERFSPTRVAEQTVEIYRQVGAQRAAARG